MEDGGLSVYCVGFGECRQSWEGGHRGVYDRCVDGPCISRRSTCYLSNFHTHFTSLMYSSLVYGRSNLPRLLRYVRNMLICFPPPTLQIWYTYHPPANVYTSIYLNYLTTRFPSFLREKSTPLPTLLTIHPTQKVSLAPAWPGMVDATLPVARRE